MDHLLQKLAASVINMGIQVFKLLVNLFIVNGKMFDLESLSTLLRYIQLIVVLLMFLSILKDLVYKLSGVEGSIYDINPGEYVMRIIMNIIAIVVIPDILKYITYLSMNMIKIINTVAGNSFSVDRSGSLFGPVDFTSSGIVVIFITIILVYQGIKSIYSLAKVQVEILIILLVAPLSLIDFYKGPDKLRSLLDNTIALVSTACIKIVLIYLGLQVIGKMDFSTLRALPNTIPNFVSFLKAFAIFAVAENPQAAVSFMLNPTRGEMGGHLQKVYYVAQIARKVVTKGV